MYIYVLGVQYFTMADEEDFTSHVLQSLRVASSADDELHILKKFQDFLLVGEENKFKLRKASVDSVENEWLNLNNVIK